MDSFGHDAGDKILQHFIKLLKKRFRKNDLIARYGGDEKYFLLCLQEFVFKKSFTMIIGCVLVL